MLEQMERTDRAKNSGIKERSTYKILNSCRGHAEHARDVVAAFGEDEQYMLDLQMTQKQKKMIKDLVGSVHRKLVERVIPEYERRGDSHKSYLEKAKIKAAGLERIWRKFK